MDQLFDLVSHSDRDAASWKIAVPGNAVEGRWFSFMAVVAVFLMEERKEVVDTWRVALGGSDELCRGVVRSGGESGAIQSDHACAAESPLPGTCTL